MSVRYYIKPSPDFVGWYLLFDDNYTEIGSIEGETQAVKIKTVLNAFPALLQQRDELLAACKAFVEAYEKSLQLEKTYIALLMAQAAIAAAEEPHVTDTA